MSTKDLQPTDSRSFTFPETGETVTAEVVNNKKHFCWRLRIGNYKTDWYTHYPGLCVIASRVDTNVKYAWATDYWNGTLPVEQVFMIKTS